MLGCRILGSSCKKAFYRRIMIVQGSVNVRKIEPFQRAPRIFLASFASTLKRLSNLSTAPDHARFDAGRYRASGTRDLTWLGRPAVGKSPTTSTPIVFLACHSSFSDRSPFSAATKGLDAPRCPFRNSRHPPSWSLIVRRPYRQRSVSHSPYRQCTGSIQASKATRECLSELTRHFPILGKQREARNIPGLDLWEQHPGRGTRTRG